MRNPQIVSSAKAYADPKTKELVFYNPQDLAHEIGHGVDFSFRLVSLSPLFQEAVSEIASDDETSEKKFLKFMKKTKKSEISSKEVELMSVKENSSNNLIDTYKKIRKFSKLPYLEYRQAIRADNWIENYVLHVFVRGFLGYYFPELSTKGDIQKKYPRLYLAMENFNSNIEEFCTKTN